MQQIDIIHELARRDLRVFISLVFNARHHVPYSFNFHNVEIMQNLNLCYSAVNGNSKAKNLIISAPPRSGKTQIVILFILWSLANNMDLRCGITTYGAVLSQQHLSELRAIIDLPIFKQIYPHFKILKNTQSEITLEGHTGGIYAIGIGGGLTGRGLDIAVIDDPHKDEQDAASIAKRTAVISWYESVLLTRLSPRGVVVCIATRWNIHDLIGHINETDKATYKSLIYKAIADEDEEHRKKGEPLHPERYNIEYYNTQRSRISNKRWLALYQQEPQPLGGTILRREYFRHYNVNQLPPQLFNRVAIYCDTASKVGANNDFTTFMLAGTIGRYDESGLYSDDLYIIDVYHKRTRASELKRDLIDFYQRAIRIYPVDSVYVEDASSGISLLQELKESYILPVRGVRVRESKATRARAILGYIENGRVLVDRDASWYEPLMQELENISFTDEGKPTHKHDDQLDALTMSVSDLLLDKLTITN